MKSLRNLHSQENHKETIKYKFGMEPGWNPGEKI